MASVRYSIKLPATIETRESLVDTGESACRSCWTWSISLFGREILRCKQVDYEDTESKALRAAQKALRDYADEQMGGTVERA